MPDFDPGCVARVPFPDTDGEARQHRPALVVARTGPGEGSGLLLWVLMITSAENRGWAGDVAIPDAAAAGLPAPSVIRCARIATIDAAWAEVRGRVLNWPPIRPDRSHRSSPSCVRRPRRPAPP